MHIYSELNEQIMKYDSLVSQVSEMNDKINTFYIEHKRKRKKENLFIRSKSYYKLNESSNNSVFQRHNSNIYIDNNINFDIVSKNYYLNKHKRGNCRMSLRKSSSLFF